MIKLIALLTMLIDHMGAVLFPDAVILRVIGRLSMPLFAYCVARGFYHSKERGSLPKYWRNMAIFAVVSQLPYDGMASVGLNIGFTWLLALLLLTVVTTRFRALWQRAIMLVLVGALVIAPVWFGVFPVEYGIYGVLAPLLFYCLISTRKENLLNYFLVLVALWIYFICVQQGSLIQIISVFSAFILALCKKHDRKIRIPKWVSYVFYPAHIALLLIIAHIAG